jgi:hypothetical protein
MALTTKGSAVAVRSTAQTLLVATGDAPTDLGQHFSTFADHKLERQRAQRHASGNFDRCWIEYLLILSACEAANA